MEMRLNDIDTRSAALGGVAGLGLGGLMGWLAADYVGRKRLQAELVSLRAYYDDRLVRLQAQIDSFERTERLRREEEERLRAVGAEIITREAYAGVTEALAAGQDYSDVVQELEPYVYVKLDDVATQSADDPDGDRKRLSALGLESLEGLDGSGDDEPGGPGAEDDQAPEDTGPAGTDIHPGSVTPDKSKPYVISFDAFGEMTSEGWDTMSITYYLGDGVLVDNRDQPIPNILMTTGPLSKETFGLMSGDDRIVYIRNHKLEHDFEVLLHDGRWTDMVGLSERHGNQAE